MIRRLLLVVATMFAVIFSLWVSLQFGYRLLALDPPNVKDVQIAKDSIINDGGVRILNRNWYRKTPYGLWEAYIEGPPYERGLTFGMLAENQVISQEESFVNQIKRLVPSEWFLSTLRYGVVFFNRNLPEHVSTELQQEIYGVSRSFADEFDFIGDKYSRILNYHAAHDIGHALQDLSIVGCTSFAVWDDYSADSSLVIGRNFDFYMGDEFARDKIVLFVRPDSGYAFASVTWAGFMGVVSGMNEHGLTVTLNAAKSSVPNGAKTPISLLAREILQYAKTIDEAYEIAKSRSTFVSESILIGSANDHAAAIIEKSPDRIDIYRSDKDKLVCSNHYQSETFKNELINIQNIEQSDSKYRSDRMNQLLEQNFPIDPAKAVDVLRNQKGIDNSELGMGNPKAINQLLAHHAVVFQPEKRLMWVSSAPYQLGTFVCYDLSEIFLPEPFIPRGLIGAGYQELAIDADPFVNSEKYDRFVRYKELKNRLFDNIALGKQIDWNDALEEEFVATNPDSYVTYLMLGDYYLEQGNPSKAKNYYELSLSKEVASEQERNKIEENLEACQ